VSDRRATGPKAPVVFHRRKWTAQKVGVAYSTFTWIARWESPALCQERATTWSPALPTRSRFLNYSQPILGKALADVDSWLETLDEGGCARRARESIGEWQR